MKERPIIFQGWEVRATLECRKTQFCRPMKPQPEDGTDCPYHIGEGVNRISRKYPHGTVGDRLWVKELWGEDYTTTALVTIGNEQQTIPTATIVYKADGHRMSESGTGWRSSTHMPREASRLRAEITGVRAIRLWDISEADALAEGITGPFNVGYMAFRVPDDSKPRYRSAVAAYEALWDYDYAKRGYGWAENPWGWLYDYRVVEEGR